MASDPESVRRSLPETAKRLFFPMVIRRMAFIGPPATGKGTQVGHVHREFGLPGASTGEMLREQYRAGTELGREAHEITEGI